MLLFEVESKIQAVGFYAPCLIPSRHWRRAGGTIKEQNFNDQQGVLKFSRLLLNILDRRRADVIKRCVMNVLGRKCVFTPKCWQLHFLGIKPKARQAVKLLTMQGGVGVWTGDVFLELPSFSLFVCLSFVGQNWLYKAKQTTEVCSQRTIIMIFRSCFYLCTSRSDGSSEILTLEPQKPSKSVRIKTQDSGDPSTPQKHPPIITDPQLFKSFSMRTCSDVFFPFFVN